MIRAARRVRRPYESHGAGDPRRGCGAARTCKKRGITLNTDARSVIGSDTDTMRLVPGRLPRVTVRRPAPGRIHPASKADIIRILRFFGERYWYGIRSIELVRCPAGTAAGRVRLASLVVPGRILLFDQPPSPWLLAGELCPDARRKLQRAGAIVEPVGGGGATKVTWPGSTLRDFLLFDGLAHEIGHHLIQHYRGKRTARVLRTRDHERLADQLAAECRTRWKAERGRQGNKETR